MKERLQAVIAVLGTLVWRSFGVFLFILGGAAGSGAFITGSPLTGILVAWTTLVVGIIGAIGTGVVVSPALGGTGVYDYVANKVGSYDMLTQVTSQAWGVGLTVVWSAVVAFVAYKIVDLVVGLRVSEEVEREGLDTAEHGERAYHI